MTNVHSATFFFLLFVLTGLAGCSGGGNAPTSSSETMSPSLSSAPIANAPPSVPLAMPVGLKASYSFGPPWPTARPVNFTITVNSPSEFVHTFRYTDCKSCDGDIQYRMAPDGSWARADFACQPPFFDTRNGGCLDYIGGWSNQDGLRGPFFGVALIAGLPLEADGTVSRSFSFGTTAISARFRIDRVGTDRIQVEAAESSFRAFPLRNNGFDLEPADCTVFNGRVIVDTTLGLPVQCQIVDESNPDNPDAFRYVLSWTNAKPDADLFAASNLPAAGTFHPDGVRFPPRDGDDKMPFGLYEALDYATSRESRVKDFLAKPDAALGGSHESWIGRTQTGDCSMACVRTDNYLWRISLRSGTEDLRFNVTKQVTTPGGLSMLSMEKVYEFQGVPFGTFPSQIPHPLSWYWEQGAASAKVGALGLDYAATARGNPANLEPLIGVNFQAPQSGFIPAVWFRIDGTVQLWRAKGAIAPP